MAFLSRWAGVGFCWARVAIGWSVWGGGRIILCRAFGRAGVCRVSGICFGVGRLGVACRRLLAVPVRVLVGAWCRLVARPAVPAARGSRRIGCSGGGRMLTRFASWLRVRGRVLRFGVLSGGVPAVEWGRCSCGGVRFRWVPVPAGSYRGLLSWLVAALVSCCGSWCCDCGRGRSSAHRVLRWFGLAPSGGGDGIFAAEGVAVLSWWRPSGAGGWFWLRGAIVSWWRGLRRRMGRRVGRWHGGAWVRVGRRASLGRAVARRLARRAWGVWRVASDRAVFRAGRVASFRVGG